MNAAGKKPTMKISEGDTKFDPAVTSTVAQRFASDSNVIGVIGPERARRCWPPARSSRRRVSPTWPLPRRNSLTNGSLPTFLRIAAPDKIQAVSTATFIKSKLHAKSVLAVDDQSAYGKPLADQVAKLLKAQGVKVKRASVTQKTSD